MPPRRILGGGWTHGVSFWPFLNSSNWWGLVSPLSLTRTSCHKITHTNGYYTAWPGWVISVSVIRLTQPPGWNGQSPDKHLGDTFSHIRKHLSHLDGLRPHLGPSPQHQGNQISMNLRHPRRWPLMGSARVWEKYSLLFGTSYLPIPSEHAHGPALSYEDINLHHKFIAIIYQLLLLNGQVVNFKMKCGCFH